MNIYTLGHSVHEYDDFFSLLARNNVSALVDVRSAPYCKYAKHYNKRPLEQECARRGLVYLFLGREIGGRPAAPKLRDAFGKVDYARVAATPEFKAGLQRLRDGLAKGYVIALICGEEDPVHCHRSRLIGEELRKLGVELQHIRGDGSILPQSVLSRRFAKEQKQLPLF